MKKYDVNMERTVISYGCIKVKANSREEAIRKAKYEHTESDFDEEDGDIDFTIGSEREIDRSKKLLTYEEVVKEYETESILFVDGDYIYFLYADEKQLIRIKNTLGLQNTYYISPSLLEKIDNLKPLFDFNKKIMDLSFEKLIEFEDFASEDDGRYYLEGLFLDKDHRNIVAANGKILNVERREELINCPYNYIIPANIINKIYADIEIYDMERKDKLLIRVKNGDWEYDIITETIEAEYPDYLKVIPNYDKQNSDIIKIDFDMKEPINNEYEDYRMRLNKDGCFIEDIEGKLIEKNKCLSLNKEANGCSSNLDTIELLFNAGNINKIFKAGAPYIVGKEKNPFKYEIKDGDMVNKILLIMGIRL
jgi:hypothetical protein